ncbi:Hypothetical protein D9617_6g093130 [Elsinoe fawcettii]|nr:Hypothetical protein D9617_6g093130 [Elsinoe fawcettii]
MSHLEYTGPAGFGQNNLKHYNYNQVVRLPANGSILRIAGQGGQDYETGEFVSTDVREQIDQAFKNVQHILTEAGGKGWKEVFNVTSYHHPLGDNTQAAMVRNFGEWMPNHKPCWTCVAIKALGGGSNMQAEIVSEAHVPE